MLRHLLLNTTLLGALVLPVAAHAADSFSAEKAPATLTVVYEFKSAGEDLPQSHERHITWTIKNRYEIKATLLAQKATGFGGMHKPDAKEQAREADRAAAAQSAATAMAPMMEKAQAAMAQCGEDQACLTREVMKMSQGIDPNAPSLQTAKDNIAKAGVMPDARYQNFMPDKQSGTYQIDETAREAYFDAACSLKTEQRCAFDTRITGTGDLTDGKDKLYQGGAYGEYDAKTGSLLFHLPTFGFAKASKTVTSQSKEVKTGTTEVTRSLGFGGLGEEIIEAKCGECRSANGSFTRQLEGDLLRRKGTLTVSWTFTRP